MLVEPLEVIGSSEMTAGWQVRGAPSDTTDEVQGSRISTSDKERCILTNANRASNRGAMR